MEEIRAPGCPFFHSSPAAPTKKSLLIDAAGEESAVDHQHLAGDKGSAVGGEINRRADQLFRFAESAHGCAHQQLLAARSGVEELGVDVGAEDAGGNGVYGDAL